MQSNVSRIIIDTNLWISFLITKNYKKLDHLIFSGHSKILFSEELIEEFIAVVKRPKFRRFFGSDDIEELLETIQEFAEFIHATSEMELCRDPKDNFILSLCFDGNADYLLTGDNDLLELKSVGKTTILTISDFLQLKA